MRLPTNYFKTGDPRGDPLGVHEVVRGWLWGAGSPIEIEPLGHDEDPKARRHSCSSLQPGA